MSRFRVLQFNIQFGQVWDDLYPDRAPIRLDATLEEIRRHDADIIILQELEQALPGGVQFDPPPHYTRLRAALAGYDAMFEYPKADARELPFGIGLAIFSRTPLRHRFRQDLPSPPIAFEFMGQKLTPTDRLLIGADTTLHGQTVGLLNAHLLAFFMMGTSSEVHGSQRAAIADRLARTKGPTILAGDFNVSQHASLVRQFGERGFRSVQVTAPTWRRRPYVLDHIFHNDGLRCVDQRVIPSPASDHHVLVADFELAPHDGDDAPKPMPPRPL